jgi:hypothetical protein
MKIGGIEGDTFFLHACRFGSPHTKYFFRIMLTFNLLRKLIDVISQSFPLLLTEMNFFGESPFHLIASSDVVDHFLYLATTLERIENIENKPRLLSVFEDEPENKSPVDCQSALDLLLDHIHPNSLCFVLNWHASCRFASPSEGPVSGGRDNEETTNQSDAFQKVNRRCTVRDSGGIGEYCNTVRMVMVYRKALKCIDENSGSESLLKCILDDSKQL